MIKTLLKYIDDKILRLIVKLCYPEYQRSRKGYKYNFHVLVKYAFWQKVLRINGKVPWPVDFRSKVLSHHRIEKGIMCDPGDSMGNYINAHGGIKFGDNVEIGPNVVIVSVNHNIYDQREFTEKKGIQIGSNVWIGANTTILAGACIGDNVVIGAGCVIESKIPSNSLVVSKSREIEIIAKKSDYKWDVKLEELI